MTDKDQDASLFSRINLSIEDRLYWLGSQIGRSALSACVVLLVVILICVILMTGIASATVNNEILDLWVEKDSRIRAETAFSEKYFGADGSRQNNIFAYNKNVDRGSVADPIHLHNLHDLFQKITKMNFTHTDGLVYSAETLCARTAVALEFTSVVFPCTRFISLDCFLEGGFDFDVTGVASGFFVEYLNETGILEDTLTQEGLDTFHNYEERPSIYEEGLTEGDVLKIVDDSCYTYNERIKPPRNIIYGGDTEDENGHLNHTGSLGYIMINQAPSAWAEQSCSDNCKIHDSEEDIETRQGTLFSVYAKGASSCRCDEPSEEQIEFAKELMFAYEEKWLEFLDEIADDYEHTQFAYFAARSAGDLTELAGEASGLTIVGGYIVMIAFVALNAFKYDMVLSRIGAAISGVLLVILSVAASFGLAAYAGISYSPTVIQVLPFLAVALGVDDMFVLLHEFRLHTDLNSSPQHQVGTTMKIAGASITLTSLCNLLAFSVASTIPLPEASNFASAAAVVVVLNYFIVVFGFLSILAFDAIRVEKNQMDILCCIKGNPANPSKMNNDERLSTKLVMWYTKQLRKVQVKVFAVCGFIGLFVLTAYSFEKVDVGLPLAEIVPHGSRASDFLGVYEDFISTNGGDLYIGIDKHGNEVPVDYAKNFKELLALQEDFQTLEHVDEGVPINVTSWISGLYDWIDGHNVSADNPEKLDDGTLIGSHLFTRTGIESDYFNELLTKFFDDSAGSVGVSKTDVIRDEKTGDVLASRVGFFETGTVTPQERIDFITISREKLDNRVPYLPVVPGGLSYGLYEQYLRVKQYLGKLVLYAAIAIAIVSLFMLFHPVCTLIMVAVMSTSIVEIYGLLYWAGYGIVFYCRFKNAISKTCSDWRDRHFHCLRINGVMVLNIVMAIAVIVEFTGHYSRAFMVTQGKTKNDRMAGALKEMMEPVVYGGISTFLGVVPMAFALFRYFQLYFFNMYAVIIFVGLANGLILLPILLSWLGPPALATQKSDGSHLVEKEDSNDQNVRKSVTNIELEAPEHSDRNGDEKSGDGEA